MPIPARSEYQQIPARAIDRWIVGVDLGQSADPTAVAVLHHRVVPLEEWVHNDKAQTWRQKSETHFDVRYLERLTLGLSYPAQVAHVRDILQRTPIKGAALVIDETGVGRAVADIFNAAGLKPMRITITGGDKATQQDAYSWHVPKLELVSGLDARLHTGELKIAAELIEAGALADELKDFQRSVGAAGRASYGARVGKHDDLVLAVAIALWFATSGPKSSATTLRF
jgi:hypothetical protein